MVDVLDRASGAAVTEYEKFKIELLLSLRLWLRVASVMFLLLFVVILFDAIMHGAVRIFQ